MRHGYVYLTKNLVNGKVYVGSHSKGIRNKRYLGSGKNIKKAIKKYGRESLGSVSFSGQKTMTL